MNATRTPYLRVALLAIGAALFLGGCLVEGSPVVTACQVLGVLLVGLVVWHEC